MYNIIIDILGHAPHLKYIIKKSLYFTFTKESYLQYPTGHYTCIELDNKFNINFNNELININNQNFFDNMFFIIPVLSCEYQHQGDNYLKMLQKFKNIYDNFINKIKGKVILLDNHDYDYKPNNFIKKININYDIIFKRSFSGRNKYKYSENTYTYPFIMCTNNDPFYKVLNDNIIYEKLSNKNNKVFWAGTNFKHYENFDENNVYSSTDRNIILNSPLINNSNILDIKKTSYEKFITTISLYKYALDLHGCSHHNKRFFEILSTNTLILAEKIDIVWPFENNDGFSEECFFEKGNPEDLYRIYNNFEKDNELYQKCLKNQLYIAKKYFNNEWIWNYIENIIK
tara:strand:+ start:5797 stop:6825 length:1029 start_codon:yes stop_codon:yes gene_type:complete